MTELSKNAQVPQCVKTDVSKSVIFPTDLRIGNFIFADLYGETKILVESICSKNNVVFNSTTGEIPFTSLKPIPLTLQLYREIEIQLIRKGFSYGFEKGKLTLYLSDEWEFESEFLHQFQNLFFFLSGSELTVC